jgi:hypothetical protein
MPIPQATPVPTHENLRKPIFLGETLLVAAFPAANGLRNSRRAAASRLRVKDGLMWALE